MASSERERGLLVALLAALGDPARAAALPAAEPGLSALLAVARRHRLTPLLSAAQNDALPPPLAEACRRDRMGSAARSMILAHVAEECVRALAAAGVRTVLLKGLDYETRLYPGKAGARATGDVDLLVEHQHRRRAFAVLDGLGFEPRAAAPGFDEADYHEVAWSRAGAEVDLHLALAPRARVRVDYGALWSAVEPIRVGGSEAWVLARLHAAVFHALHMAIDHYDVPAIYLVDLTRLLPAADDVRRAAGLARAWEVARPFATAVALTAAFVRPWPGAPAAPPPPSAAAQRIVAAYGPVAQLPRAEQLLRKVLHFDRLGQGARYLAIQSRRNLRELVEARVRRRSVRDRLGVPPAPISDPPPPGPDSPTSPRT